MLTKEELVIENTRLKDKLALYREINHRQACIIKESLELNKPCQEYALYKPQPYKLVDLKPKMWVWDDKFKDCIKIKKVFEPCELYPNGSFKSYHDLNEEDCDFVEFEEGRFFPVTKALEYQGEQK